MANTSPPSSILHPPSSPVPIPAIVLAAGSSTRTAPRFKPLLDIAGLPMIRRVVDTLLTICHPIIVVTGHRADEVRAAAEGAEGVTFVFNSKHETGGMVSSAQVGVRALPNDVPFLLSLGDQPAILPETLSQLLHAWRLSAPTITIPAYHGKRGHPLILSAACVADILNLNSFETLKTVVERYKHQTTQVDVDDPGVTMDVDTQADYDRLLEYIRQRPPF